MTTQNIYSMTDVWDDVGTTFKGISLSVTDTASASGSLLMDLQVGGVSQFSVQKNGTTFIAVGGTLRFAFGRSGSSSYFNMGSTGGVTWSASDPTAGTDLILQRDAADTLAQRRSTNPQAFRVYNTYTDASNYERVGLYFSGNIAFLETQSAGTGSQRALRYNALAHVWQIGGANIWQITSTGHFLAVTDNTYDIGAATASRPRHVHQTGYLQTSEMTAPSAPAANGVRIYAEDDGTGKTRLMALFATGAAQQIAIEP